MATIFYQLTTLSSLIVSPRSALAFYKALDEFSLETIQELTGYTDMKQIDKLKVIYPFYQYGTYETYHMNNAAYYLPGSSIKGALCQESTAAGSFLVDDILIPKEAVVLHNLYKAQYLNDCKEACFNVFFDHVGVEMVRANVTLEGQFRLNAGKQMEDFLIPANESTQSKMKQMQAYLLALVNQKYANADLLESLQKAIVNLSSLLDQKHIFLLGGYKGLLHAMKVQQPLSEKTTSAVFLDPETMLPHGLVTIKVTGRRAG